MVPHAAGERAPIAAVLRALVGPVGATLGSLGAMVSIYGWTTGTLLPQSPRVLYAMTGRGELPAALGRVHPRFRTPHAAIALFALATLAAFAALPAASRQTPPSQRPCGSVYLRSQSQRCCCWRRASEPPGFRLPGALARGAARRPSTCCVALATRTFEQAWILAALILAGLPLRALARRRGERAA